MIHPKTNARLAEGYKTLKAAQSSQAAPPPGRVSIKLYARYAGVDEKTIRNIERRALCKLAAALLESEAITEAQRAEALKKFPELSA